MPLEHGVSYYTDGVATVIIHFPEDKTVCQWCPYCRNEDSLKRWKCLLTGEYLVYPFTSRGNQCPVVIKQDEKETVELKNHPLPFEE